jgi:hypothetical protein
VQTRGVQNCVLKTQSSERAILLSFPIAYPKGRQNLVNYLKVAGLWFDQIRQSLWVLIRLIDDRLVSATVILFSVPSRYKCRVQHTDPQSWSPNEVNPPNPPILNPPPITIMLFRSLALVFLALCFTAISAMPVEVSFPRFILAIDYFTYIPYIRFKTVIWLYLRLTFFNAPLRSSPLKNAWM